MLTENALTTLEERYLLRGSDGSIIETPEQLWWRIADAVACVEPHDRVTWSERFHELLSKQLFLPNTPTIMNAGKENGQLSACYVLPIEDSMVGIFTTLKNAAIIHQTGGGTGFDFSRLRPEGSMVSNKSGVSTGPLAFCQVYDKATEVIKQGASRRGANMMNLRVDHPDILKFIDMKLEKGVMTNFNVSVTITDEFMEALTTGSTYELYHPFTGTVGELDARQVWDKIAENAHRSAEPGIIFIDRVNSRSPYKQEIEATNPCGEQPLPPYGSCNLGSIDISKFVREGVQREIDFGSLRDTIRVSTRFLDNVIDANVYPLPELTEHAKKYRNIGLGLMGWADALLLLGIPYNSKEAVELGREVMHFVNKEAHQYSEELAQEKGVPSEVPFDVYFEYSSPYRRNATLTTMAPTGSLCILADCSSGLEPNFSLEDYEKHVLDRVLTVKHRIYHKAKNEGWYTPEVFVTAEDISPTYHVLMQAAFQEHCDSGISKTINLPKHATVSDVQQAYQLAYETGCKGITVYREGSREGVLRRSEQGSETDAQVDDCCDAPNIIKESGCETCKTCGTSKCLIA